jgi:hypothetical protein
VFGAEIPLRDLYPLYRCVIRIVEMSKTKKLKWNGSRESRKQVEREENERRKKRKTSVIE